MTNGTARPQAPDQVTRPTPDRNAVVTSRNRSTTRETLLEAASTLMREGDTLDISLSEIAKKAKTNSALIGYHFGSKRGLLLPLIERDSLLSLFQFSHLLDMPITATKKLKYHLAGVINIYERYPYLNRILGVVIRDSAADESAAIADRFIRPIVNAYARLVREGVESGEFKPIEPMNLYFICIGMCGEIFASRPVLRNCFGIQNLTEAHKKSFINDVTSIILTGTSKMGV